MTGIDFYNTLLGTLRLTKSDAPTSDVVSRTNTEMEKLVTLVVGSSGEDYFLDSLTLTENIDNLIVNLPEGFIRLKTVSFIRDGVFTALYEREQNVDDINVEPDITDNYYTLGANDVQLHINDGNTEQIQGIHLEYWKYPEPFKAEHLESDKDLSTYNTFPRIGHSTLLFNVMYLYVTRDIRAEATGQVNRIAAEKQEALSILLNAMTQRTSTQITLLDD